MSCWVVGSSPFSFDLPYDEERGSCKCGSGDEEFDEQEGGGFMVPCTPAEALASIDLWKDSMRRYCALSLKVRNKKNPLVRQAKCGEAEELSLSLQLGSLLSVRAGKVIPYRYLDRRTDRLSSLTLFFSWAHV